MVIRSIVFSLFFVCFAVPAFAADNPDRATIDTPSDTRVGAYGNAGIAIFTRPQDANSGVTLGGELAWMFHGTQGIRVGYNYGAGVFGPEVNAFDVAYSFQWNSKSHLHGLSWSVGALIGPSFAIVNYDGNTPDIHATFGGRVGAFGDLHASLFTLGIDASYRVGFSNPYGVEGYATFGLHSGITFELAPSR